MDYNYIILILLFIFLFLIFLMVLHYLKKTYDVAVTTKNKYLYKSNLSLYDQRKFDNAVNTIKICLEKKMWYKNIMLTAFASLLLLSCIKIKQSIQTNSIEFSNKVINRSQLGTLCNISDIHYSIWADLTNTVLQFNIWTQQEDTEDFKLLELNYANAISEISGSEFPIDISTANQYIEELYFLGYLQKTERDLTSIDFEIHQLQKNNFSIPDELYLEELVKRIESCQNNPSCSNFYQAGRSAKDVLYQKLYSGSCSYQEMITYASLAIYFFRITLSFSSDELNMLSDENCKITRSYIYEQIGIIFLQLHIKLYSEDSDETSQYQQHFLLAANAYLDKGLADSELKLSNMEYNKALVEYYGIIRYGYTDLCDACYAHANNYIKQFGNSAENSSYVEDSKFIISYLKRKYDYYITTRTVSSNSLP